MAIGGDEIARLHRIGNDAKDPIRRFDAIVRSMHPGIHWERPIVVNGTFACRLCIARLGLRSGDGNSYTDAGAWTEHLILVHVCE